MCCVAKPDTPCIYIYYNNIICARAITFWTTRLVDWFRRQRSITMPYVAMDLITSGFDILCLQGIPQLMQDLTKVVLFVICLPLKYFVHNRWETEKQEREKEIYWADQDWAREVRQAEQEREIEIYLADQECAGELCEAEQEFNIRSFDLASLCFAYIFLLAGS